MQYRYIGKSGLRVTSICLGTMTFGTSVDKKMAFEIMDKAYDFGINFFDTAEIYPVPPSSNLFGLTEEWVGDWLKTKPRDSVVLASKVAGAANGWFVPPVRHGLTAIDSFHIKKAIEGSLKRLKTDYIDLYQMHWPDTVIPIEESLRAFDSLVKDGKVRYIGTSNDNAYGLTKANEVSRYEKLARFESIQNNFSINNPRFLDEIANVCRAEKISLLPYSPLAGGVLSGKYNQAFVDPNARYAKYLSSDNNRIRAQAAKFANEKALESAKKLVEVSKNFQISPVTMAIAWSKQFDFVASTIIGATDSSQLNESLAAMNLVLSDEILFEISKVQKQILYPMG
jgi:aryl-alcohol dehydrogenase-like predicted oxidoreductase